MYVNKKPIEPESCDTLSGNNFLINNAKLYCESVIKSSPIERISY